MRNSTASSPTRSRKHVRPDDRASDRPADGGFACASDGRRGHPPRLYGRLGAVKAGYTALVTGAFCEAVERRFGAHHDAADVVEFVAEVRARSDRLASEIGPVVGERVIRAVFGADSIGDLSDAAVAGTQIVLLAALLADEHFDDAGLDAFLARSRALADQLMSRSADELS